MKKNCVNFLIFCIERNKIFFVYICMPLSSDFFLMISVFLFISFDRVSAHRLVLSATSAYFRAMFNGSLRESQEEEITLGDVLGEPLEMIVQYCYSGRIDLREENVETLLATACLLQMNSVVTACCNFLAKQLHPSNCIGFALFAEQQSCYTLLDLANKYTNNHFMCVCKNQEFYQLDVKQLANLLKSDDLNVTTEQDVFHALMSWVQHDLAKREKHVPELLSLVRLPLLTPSVCYVDVSIAE